MNSRNNFSNNYRDKVIILETNIDDNTPEELGFCMDLLFEAGAKDVTYTPIYMKKGRPAFKLTVICEPSMEQEITTLIFKHTSSIGMRRRESERTVMEREIITVDTPYGPVKAKRCTYHDLEKIIVEYESAVALSRDTGVSIQKILRSVN